MVTEQKMNKYSTGDKIEVVNYGHIIFVNETLIDEFKGCVNLGKNIYGQYIIDISPDKIGCKAIVCKKELIQAQWKYCIEWENGDQSCWYDEEQLKLI